MPCAHPAHRAGVLLAVELHGRVRQSSVSTNNYCSLYTVKRPSCRADRQALSPPMLTCTGLRPEAGVADQTKFVCEPVPTGSLVARRRIERQPLTSLQPCRGCSNVSLYALPALIHGTRTCAQLHSHVRRTLVPPSAASGRETGSESLLRVGVITPSAPPTRLQLGHCLPYCMPSRVGAVVHAAPGRYENVTCTR